MFVLASIENFRFIEVNQILSIEDVIRERFFDEVDECINSKNLSKPENQTMFACDPALFHFEGDFFEITSDRVIQEMLSQGYRPATVWELVAFANDNLLIQQKFSVLALGSTCLKENVPHIAYLASNSEWADYRKRDKRYLRLNPDKREKDRTEDCVFGWVSDYCRFLGIKLS